MDWHDVLPRFVAINQKGFERAHAAVRARRAGLTFREIGLRLGVTTERARQLAMKGERLLARNATAPVVLYFREREDVRKIAHRTMRANLLARAMGSLTGA